MRDRWWYLCLVYFLTVTEDAQETSGFQIPTFREVVSNATMPYYINGPPIPNPPKQLDLSRTSGRQLLFPFMNFTCSGTITRLAFLGWLSESSEQFDVASLTSWPYFSLWHQDRQYTSGYAFEEINPLVNDYDQLNININRSILSNQLVEVALTINTTFSQGDILGIRLQHDQSINENGINMAVLKQSEVYDQIQVCDAQDYDSGWCIDSAIENQEIPYIAIETDPTSQRCAMGFLTLKKHPLGTLTVPRSLYLPGLTRYYSIPKLSMPLTQSGPLRGIVIAAKFNVTVQIGWPKIQILRTARNRTGTYIAFTTSTMEPRPTKYLNLYDYDLAAIDFDVQVGDKLNLSWYGNILQHDQIRFSLAYYNNSKSPATPMISIIVGNCDSETDLNTLYCEDINTTASSVTIIIIIAVVFSLLLLIILLISLAVFTFVVKQRRKSVSVNVTGPIEMSTQPRMLHNTPRNELERGPTLENDYLESDDRAPSNSAPALVTPVAKAHDNQQDDYYYYKLYEWGVFVPTADQRGKLASSGANNDDSVYSTLGESQYSKLKQFNKGPKFFESTDNYWKPASDTEGLYQQLSSKKYREILRQQIQLSDSLGSGQFGNVMKGVWLLSGGSKEVAVKMLKKEASETEKVRFLQEAAINGQFHHPNVVKLMGVVTIGEPVMIVLEFLSNGDLRGYLMKIQPTPGEMVPSNTPHTLLRFCKEIAAGMKYLAGKGFIHRDLAARNILVSEEKTCKISDFGMSRDLEDESYYISHGGMIPVKWTAPEALHYKKYSSLSDVWSFGCVVYEIWSLGHKPFEGYSKYEVISKVDSGFRLPPPPGCPRDIYHIMIQCWHPNKNLRPSFSDLHTSLSDHTLSLGMKEECHTVAERPDQPLPLSLHPQAHTIGAPLEASKELYNDLQKTYINE